jgi:hypothetical protein
VELVEGSARLRLEEEVEGMAKDGGMEATVMEEEGLGGRSTYSTSEEATLLMLPLDQEEEVVEVEDEEKEDTTAKPAEDEAACLSSLLFPDDDPGKGSTCNILPPESLAKDVDGAL